MSSFKVAVVLGSLRKGSYSLAVTKAVAGLAAPRLELNVVEIGDLPLYNPDLETDTPPPAWLRFRADVAAADAVLFVTPEYNRSIPGALKNAIDVGSRPYGKSAFSGKPAAIISQSPGMLGGFGANHHLRQPLVFLNMPVLQQPEVYLSKVADAVTETGEIKVEATRAFLQDFANKFADWIAQQRKA
jgi:chromate reductase